jgi:hypothetical protein
MMELPRAALMVGEIAETAEFRRRPRGEYGVRALSGRRKLRWAVAPDLCELMVIRLIRVPMAEIRPAKFDPAQQSNPRE